MKRILPLTVLMLVLGLAGEANTQTLAYPTGAHNQASTLKKPKPKPNPKHVTSVPEPGSLLLIGVGLFAGAGALKRKA